MARAGTHSLQGAPTLVAPPFHLHSLCSKAPANPQSLSALETLEGKRVGMATSSGRGRPGPGSSPSAALPCTRADCAATLCVGSVCHSHHTAPSC